MTKEEAIKHLEFMAKGYQNLLDNDERCLEAVGKGYKGEVEAQESLADVYKTQIDALNLAIKALEQQPCEDCISRQMVIDSIRNYFHDEYYQRTSIQDCRDCLIEDVIKSLPSVTPIRSKGEWKYDKTIQNWRCSKCNETPKTLGYVGTKEFMTEHFKFCNHCGADMRGET